MQATYYSCTTVGCQSTAVSTNTYITFNACTAACQSWGCNMNVIQEDTKIYVFYDISSMSSSWLQNAYTTVNDWVASGIPGFTGVVYHTLDHKERWLQSDYIVYSGTVGGISPGGEPAPTFSDTVINQTNQRNAIGWKQTEVNNGAVWYDLFLLGQTEVEPSGPYAGLTVNSSGLPPKADYGDNVLVIIFSDESAPAYHDENTLQWGSQPTTQFISDYDNYTGKTWTGVQAASGTINQFLYPATSGNPSATICSMSTPCTSGPWSFNAACQPPTQITSTFLNANFGTVVGCTGPNGAATATNPNPCPWNPLPIPAGGCGFGGAWGFSQSFPTNKKNFAFQALASISSGNKTNLDGTWQVGSAPIQDTNANWLGTSNLSNITNMGWGWLVTAQGPNLENENPYWVDGTGHTIDMAYNQNPPLPYTPNHGALGLYGWGVNVAARPFTSPQFITDINDFLSSGYTAETLCTSAATFPVPNFPYNTWDDCNESDGCGKYTCAATGCIPWSTGPYDSLSSCTASCFSQECRASGCTSVAGSGGTYYNSASTQDALTACTASCVSYNCSSTGCEELTGSGGTFQTSATCTASCVSYACADAGCTTFPGTGNTPYTTSSACTASCVSWNCTDDGCVERNGTGGTYTTHSACTASCQSYGCSDNGCLPQLGTGGTYYDSSRPQDSLTSCTANCISYSCSTTGCVVQPGSGGTYFDAGGGQDCLTACTASCQSYSCTTTGCQLVPGHFGPYQYDINNPSVSLHNCTGNCKSYNCTPTGCVEVDGDGGHYTNYNSCSASCYSYNCSSTGCQVSGGTGGTYSSLALCQTPCQSWNCHSTGCPPQPGTGGTFSSYADCQTGDSVTHISACTSFECRASGCTQIVGTGGTDYSACTATCSSYTCTDTGCTIQVGSGGTYYSSARTQDALTACTATCRSWYCDITGCVERTGPGGDFSSLSDCQTGDTINGISACTSYECRASGCTLIAGTGGTDTTFLLQNCTGGCVSWNCSDSGCTELVGSGGTFQTIISCESDCVSYFCDDTGCNLHQGTGSTFGTVNQCLTSCTSYFCTDLGCAPQTGTGGTFTDLNDCSSACTSFECRDSGCTEIVGTGTTNALTACTASCQSYNCTDTGCVIIAGSGGTFYNSTSLQDSYTACTASCASFYCTDIGCTKQTGTGGTFSTSASCTATCVSWSCTDSGCTEILGTGGTFSSLIDCQTGDSVTHISACTSFFCTDIGCTEQTGTGGTFSTSATCTASCASFYCTPTGCEEQTGTGGTFSTSATCTATCQSYNCSDEGCIIQNGTGGTYYNSSSLQDSLTACTASCTSWFCTVTGCTEQAGTGGTYANSGLCSTDGACVSYYCMDTGCTQIVGTGGTVSSSGTCTASCTSWNCSDSGCVEQQGTGGTYAIQVHCTTACTSFFCTDTGCTEQSGTGGTFSSLIDCQTGDSVTHISSCTSFYCTDIGCTEQIGTGGTYSTSATCTASCQSWNCSDNGCVVQDGTGGTYSTLISCTASCYSYQCTDTGCTQVTGSGGTHYNISYPWHAQTACTASCVSWDCGPSGVVTGPNNSACIEQVGTGSTWTIEQDCVLNCQSWNCGDSGCEFAAGSGGTWYYLNDPSLSQTNCAIHCWSWWCDTIGCQDEPGSGQTFYVANSGDITFDNVYAAETACTYDCQSWSCTTQSGLYGPSGQPTGCLEIPGTGVTNTVIVFDECYTACTSYDCGAQGCYLAVGGQGLYPDIGTCENACKSWQCTDSGCQELEGDTGTTTQPQCDSACTSYDCTDDGCVQRPGLGGQHVDLTACTASCKSWFCTTSICIEHDGSGATFSSLNSCTNDCQSWNCEDYGCSNQAGTGATHSTSAICSTACTSYLCNAYNTPPVNNGELGCYQLSGTGWTYSSLIDCQTGDSVTHISGCTSWNCDGYPTGCNEVPGWTGMVMTQEICSGFCQVYFCSGIDDVDAPNATWPNLSNPMGCYSLPGNPLFFSTNYQYSNLIDCEDFCTSWECLSTGCTQYAETGHTHAQGYDCLSVCDSWECSGSGPTYGCAQILGTGGTWTAATECDCLSWDCSPTGCVSVPGAGGQYPDYTSCTATCISYSCTDTGCVQYQNNSGAFSDITTCSASCLSYNCSPTGCTQYTGTGGSFSDLYICATACTSWDCLASGCTEYYGTGHGYTSLGDCIILGPCVSWDCTPSWVQDVIGTGGTYNSYAQATGMCLSYDCTSSYNNTSGALDGCHPYNYDPSPSPTSSGWWGTDGVYDSMSSCTASCVHWGCNNVAVTQFAKIYVYYDITSMGFDVLDEAYDRIEAWVSSIPGWSGDTYHTLTQASERWLAFPKITYSGRTLAPYMSSQNTFVNSDTQQIPLFEFPHTGWNSSVANHKISSLVTWAENTPAGLNGNFYDVGVSGSCMTPLNFTIGGVSYTNKISCLKGMPPTASTNDDVVNIVFLDEANRSYHSYHYTYGTRPNFFANWANAGYSSVTYSMSCLRRNSAAAGQPTKEFRYDYDRYMEMWTTITGTTSGSVRSFFYPRPASTAYEPNQMLALNAFASIHSGNQAIPDGTWLPGTAPYDTGTANQLNTTIPPFYSKANLRTLETASPNNPVNPYTQVITGITYDYDDPTCTGNTIHWTSDTMTGGVGFLDRFGWGINVSLDTFYASNFNDDLGAFLAASSGPGFMIDCVSAETLMSLQYPYESETGCTSGCTGLSCSAIGCVLGSVDQFISSVNCSAACQSYNCSPTGCIWQYGTGGTFYNATDGSYGLLDCQAFCTSYNCVDPLSLSNPNDQGCETRIGTGGTFTTYSSCTASCQSWNCECDCTIYAPISAMTACTNMPNTGGTYSALTSCTATCSTGASWYCSGATITPPSPCFIFCGNGGYYSDGVTPINLSLVYGPFSTSGAASNSCCPVPSTWDCTGTTAINSCSNRTLIPGTYVSASDALVWFTTYLAAQPISGFSYESTTPAYLIPNSCDGPNGGAMYELLGVAHLNINGGVFYSNWNDFVNACVAASVPLVLPGMTFTTVNDLLFIHYSDNIIVGAEPCLCIDQNCGCEEIFGGGGEFSALTACTAVCCTGKTSWNCIVDQYRPICITKPSVGVLNLPIEAMDHFRTITPTRIFALDKFYPYFNTAGAPVNVSYATAYANTVGQGQATWQDCYKKVPTIGNPLVATFIPATYIESISHPLISGGTPFHTWQTFIDSVVAAGVTGTAAAATNSVCTMIDTQLSPFYSFGCTIITKPCCSSEDCYCYELFTTGGTYEEQIDCETNCCPINTGYTCDLASTCIGPIPFSNLYTNWHTGPFALNNCLSYCSGTTTWDCVPEVISGTCDDSQYGEYPPTSPAFQISSIAYPFTTCAITNPGGIPGVVEKVLTSIAYFNPSWAFSSVTWELGSLPVIVPPQNPCKGANGFPLYRLMALGHIDVDFGTMYYSWGSFVAAAQAQGTTISVSQNLTQFSTGPWSVDIKPCVCTTTPCHCIEVPGTTGMFSTSAICYDTCCSIDSWNCTLLGCEDPGDGTGAYTVLIDCEHDCREWLCGASIPPNHVDGKIASGIVGTSTDQVIYLVNTTSPNTIFGDYRYEDINYPPTNQPCPGNSGYPWKYVTGIFVPIGQVITTPQEASWDDFINFLNTTYNWLAVTTSMAYQTVDSIIQSNNNGYGIKVVSSMCVCQTLPCDCHEIDGTGHTNGYHITNYNDCEHDCCSGVCIDECGVLLIGNNHGVSTYDITTNTAVHLSMGAYIMTNSWDLMDIAAGHDMIWFYDSDPVYTVGTSIEEHKIISLCPFQSAYVRTITCGSGIILGRGMAPTGNPHELICNIGSIGQTIFGKILKIDITNNVLTPSDITQLFTLPTYAGGAISCISCVNPMTIGDPYVVSGDILYDWATQTMLILYGAESPFQDHEMWIGEFDYSGTQLQAYHITAGLPQNDYFEGLFEDSPTGKKYAVSRFGTVCEVKLTPLTIMPPLQGSTIPPYIQGYGYVNVAGATNIVNSTNTCVTLVVPVTYNCLPAAGGCVDPGDGSGQFSMFNGASSVADALSMCQSSCVPNTWDCNSTPQITDAPSGTGIELPVSVTDDLAAYDFVASDPALHFVQFETIYFQNFGVTSVGSSFSNTNLANQPCWITAAFPYTNGWKYSLSTIMILPLFTNCVYWAQVVNTLVLDGVPGIGYTSSRSDVYNAAAIYYNVTIPFTQTSQARTCFSGACNCTEVIGSGGGFNTSGACENSCCPTYDCVYQVGCVDPLDGSGKFTGPNSLNNCQNECKELLCTPSQVLTDTCVGKIIWTNPGTGQFPTTDQNHSAHMKYMADPANGLQNVDFTNYKFIWSTTIMGGTNLCTAPGIPQGGYADNIWSSNGTQWIMGPGNNMVSFNANTWYDVLYFAQNNAPLPCPGIDLTWGWTDFWYYLGQTCDMMGGWNGANCHCTYTNCGCQTVIGTGHTGSYPYWDQTDCDDACCPNAINVNQARMGLIDELDKLIYESKDLITTNVDYAINTLNTLREDGKTGNDCEHCNNNNGVCLYNGCLSYTNLRLSGTSQFTWVFGKDQPSGPSYDCQSTGCYLVWAASSGQFNGINALSDCQADCVSYNCIPGVITNDCDELIRLDVIGEADTALAFIADKNNGYQTQKFSDFKYEEVVSEKPEDSCPATDGNIWSKISTIKATDLNSETIIVNNTTTWSTFISELKSTGYPVTDDMSYNTVVQQGMAAEQKFKITIDNRYCRCSGQPCHCTQVVGTGGTGTYPNLTLCNQAASTNPCCGSDINSYNCTINGCEQHSGVGVGTYNSSYALWECQQDCVAWGCHDVQLTITSANTVVTPQTVTGLTTTTGMSSADTVIHVWYDTSSMGTALLNQAQNSINAWVTQEQLPGGFLDGWVGLVTHSFSSAEDWIKWPHYSIEDWSGTTYKNLIVVCLIDESNNVFPNNDNTSYTPGTPIITSAGTIISSQGKVPPVNHWYQNKNMFISSYNDWISAGGTIQTLVYAASEFWGNNNMADNRRDFIRHIFASINGSDLHVTNGNWTLDPTTNNPVTTNGNLIFGDPGQNLLYGTNDFIDLSWAVTTDNGYRNDVPLTSYGVYGIYNRRGTAAFTPQALGNDIQQFITTYPVTTTNVITWTVYNSATTYTSSTYTVAGQCVSAQTTLNTSYPFVSQTDCDIQDCDYSGWNCGINGCYSQTNGQYLTWDDCDEACYSYTCETQITGLITEGTDLLGTYCHEFYNGSGTTIPVTGSGYDVLSYYMDSVVNGYNYANGYGNVNWFTNLWDNTGNNTGGVLITTYPAILAYSGGNSGMTATTTGLIVEDDGLGNCETPSGGRLCRLVKVELIDQTSGLAFFELHSETLEYFIQILMGNPVYTGPVSIPSFPSGIPGTYQGMSLYTLIQIGQLNSTRQFNVKIYIKGCPCSHSCDCIKLAGTGQTGTYYYPTNQLGAYHDCVDDCCASLHSWTCPTNASTASQYGCVDPLDGSGAYTTKALCDAACIVTWDCFPATNTYSCSNVNTYIPFNLTQSYFTSQDPGFMMGGNSGPQPLSSTYGPGGVNSDIEALMYILDQDKGLHNKQLNTIGYSRGQTYLTANQQCDYPNSGGHKLGSMEYFYQNDLSMYYCYEYEMRINGVSFMAWSSTAQTQGAYNRCNGTGSGNYSTIPETKYTSVKQMLDVIEWMYSQPEITVLGQVLKAGPCNGNSKHFSSLFNTGPNTAPCNSSQPAPSNGFKSNLMLKDFWEAGLFRPHYGWGINATTPVNNWLSSWGSGISSNGTNIQHGFNQQIMVRGRDININGTTTVNSTECQCLTTCNCQPVIGTSGMWTSNMDCQVVCCPNNVCTICCIDGGGIIFTIQQIGLNCVCPSTTYQVQCGIVPQIQSCKVGQTWNTELKQCVADTALPCVTKYCSSGYIWNELMCDCVLCQEQQCSDGRTWNSSTCKCETEALPCPEEACGTNHVWDAETCTCKCVTQYCDDGYIWNSSDCKCDAIPGDVVYGCTDPTATNYNSLANTNDGTCTYDTDSEGSETLPHSSALILNELTHEYVRGCILSSSSDEVVEIYGTYTNLNNCLNSGVAGTWTTTRDISRTDTFGITGSVVGSLIPMCCQNWVNTKTTEEYPSLDYQVCHDWCISQAEGHGGNYVPLYNVVGPNTTDEDSILTYYTNITFINHVRDGSIIINSEMGPTDGVPPLH